MRQPDGGTTAWDFAVGADEVNPIVGGSTTPIVVFLHSITAHNR